MSCAQVAEAMCPRNKEMNAERWADCARLQLSKAGSSTKNCVLASGELCCK